MKELTIPLAAFVAALLCRQASAATFTIPNGGVSQLKAAITASNSNSQDDTIELASGGIYTLTVADNFDATGVGNGLPVIAADGAHKLTIHGNGATIRRSTAGGTPVFRIFYIGAGSNVTVSGLTITNGAANGNNSSGGGILVDHAVATLQNCALNQNSAGDLGGGIYNGGTHTGGAVLTISGCTFNQNSASEGGGIYNDGLGIAAAASGVRPLGIVLRSVNAALTVSNSTFYKNTASDLGGAIYNDGDQGGYGTLALVNATFSQNSASAGGALHNETDVSGIAVITIHSTIFKTGASGGNIDISTDGTFMSLGYNISDDAANGDATTGPGGTLNATGDIRNTDPKLDPAGLKSNGGPTPTVALLPGSPATDHGDNSVLSPPLSLTTDQRGVARKVGPTVDIGAFEFTASGDFNADNHPDYALFNPTTRQTAIWYLNGPAQVGSVYGPTLPAGWSLVGTADFNGDGNPDYLLYNASTLQTAIWYLNGPTHLGGAYGPTLPTGWSIVGTGDFNGDGKPDYLLFNASTNKTAIWYLNGPAFISSAYGPTLPADWTITGVADFNGDGKPDLVLFNAGTRQTAIWYMNNATHVGGAYGPTPPAGWVLQGVADFNGDGQPDFVLYEASTRDTAIWYLNGLSHTGGAYGPTLAAGYNLVAP